MSENTQPSVVVAPDPAVELETLRKTHQEVLAKSATRKAKITELEATNAKLQGDLTAANASIHQLTVEAPLKAMAESISLAPEIWLEKFTASYKVESIKGALTLLSADGKPVLKDGAPVKFEHQALIDLLTTDTHPQSKIFKSILIGSRASGGNAAPQGKGSAGPKAPAIQFGLR
jgi:hypothetical protein